MSAAANALLLLAAAAFFVAGYRLAWTASVEFAALPPALQARMPRLRRLHRLSMLLAFVSCAAMAAHLAVRDVLGGGPDGSQVALWTGGTLLAVALWCLAESGGGR